MNPNVNVKIILLKVKGHIFYPEGLMVLSIFFVVEILNLMLTSVPTSHVIQCDMSYIS